MKGESTVAEIAH